MINSCLAAAFAAFVLAATPRLAWSADPAPNDARSTPGSVVPSTGVAAVPVPASAPGAIGPRPTGAKAGSLSGPGNLDCAALRRQYARSQACFAPYRLSNGGLKPEAFKRCREVANPAPRCGSIVVERG